MRHSQNWRRAVLPASAQWPRYPRRLHLWRSSRAEKAVCCLQLSCIWPTAPRYSATRYQQRRIDVAPLLAPPHVALVLVPLATAAERDGWICHSGHRSDAFCTASAACRASRHSHSTSTPKGGGLGEDPPLPQTPYFGKCSPRVDLCSFCTTTILVCRALNAAEAVVAVGQPVGWSVTVAAYNGWRRCLREAKACLSLLLS